MKEELAEILDISEYQWDSVQLGKTGKAFSWPFMPSSGYLRNQNGSNVGLNRKTEGSQKMRYGVFKMNQTYHKRKKRPTGVE